MSADVKDFYGKDVAEAMKKACETLGVAQENLTIEVVETGSSGIFGLIRRKAHIRVSVQAVEDEPSQPTESSPSKKSPAKPKKKARPAKTKEPLEPVEKEPEIPEDTRVVSDDKAEGNKSDEDKNSNREPLELSAESLTIIKEELTSILDLMGCSSTITVENIDGAAHCKISEDHEETLTAQDGRVLDSLQYLLRKIVSKKISGRIQITIDVGDYRERRYLQLRELAVEYAALVKENAKTQVIPSLNPSERRVVHVVLQDDPEIRSRSVGEGLFKKVLIYKPGKARKNNGRKRGRNKNRGKSGSGSKQET